MCMYMIRVNVTSDLYFQYMSVKNRRIPAVWIGKIAQTLNISTDKILKENNE